MIGWTVGCKPGKISFLVGVSLFAGKARLALPKAGLAGALAALAFAAETPQPAHSSSIIAPVAGAAFTGAGAIESRNRFALQTGITVDFNERISGNLDYQGTFSGASQNNRIQGGITVRF